MKTNQITALAAAVLSLALAAPIPAQTVPGSMLFTPNVDLSQGAQNGYVGYVGGVFLTSYNYYPQVNSLGYFDFDGDGLVNSHTLSLWDLSAGNILLATAVIPAGTEAALVNGFRWVQLPETVNLTYNNWYLISAQVDNVDTWGDFITNNGGAGQINWSEQYVNLQDGYQFSRAGRYGDTSLPGGQAGTDAIYPAANLGYNVIPEPGTAGLLAVAAFLSALTQRRKR
ncbi:MAG: hypothetical protein M9920_16595 [Verrucomicrobiae bacterium]|nr:hypothetical protein [Verrucomicrobiae bacterium]